MRLKPVAICIVGQFRTFDRTCGNIHRAIEELSPESDCFFCFNDAPPDISGIVDRFQPVDLAAYDHAANPDRCKSSGWGFLALAGGFKFYQYQRKLERDGFLMAYGFRTLYERVARYEAENAGRYELVVKLRPDIFLHHKFPAYHENYLGLRSSEKIVCATHLGGCGTDPNHPRKCLKDTSTIITRPALESYLMKFYRNFVTGSFGHLLDKCPECKLGATLANEGVEKRAFRMKESIVRLGDAVVRPREGGGSDANEFEGYAKLI